jgi:hypothetical protein
MNGKLSIVIPSRNEIFLQKTIQDVLKNASGDIEVFPILDGYEPPVEEIVIDPRVTYIRLPKVKSAQKRHGINKAIRELSTGEFVMSLDAHCMVAPGFDEVLKKDLEEDWVAVPRRHRLDAENWCLQDQSDTRPPIDYEYLMYPKQFDPRAFHGFKWDERTLARKDVLIDDIITMQGSIWIMHRSHYDKMGLMQVEGYTGFGQEAEEISFKTWLNGGRVIVNKNTWYAHLHKGSKYGRMYFMGKEENRSCYRYAYNFWANEHKEFFVNLVKKYSPMPGWPINWEEDLYA